MKKKFIVIISLILILISLLPLILKHKTTATFPKNIYCNVNFQHPIYEFKDTSGNSIFVLDENGNLYLNGTKVLFNQTGIAQPKTGFGLQVNSQLYWAFNNTNVNIHGEIMQKQTIPNKPGDSDIIFRNPITKEPLAIFDGTTGDLKIKGLVIYNGYYDGLSVNDNAFNSNCTTLDNYNSSTGTDYYQDYYCNRIKCTYRNIDLDLSQERCEGDNLNWNLGGNVNPTTCCGDDANEFNLTRKCNSGCTSDNSDDACCDNNNDAVYNSNCYPETNEVCSPWNNNIVSSVSNNKWSFVEDCSTHCIDSCAKYVSCSNGHCSGEVDAPLGQNCTEDIGFVNPGICNPNYACSNKNGNMIYNNGGSLNCTATCGGGGHCDHATNCIDCSQSGIVNGCACACGGYGIQESLANGNCNDGIDNDCDGNKDSNDPDCCLDADGDGYYLQSGCGSDVDCNDSDPETYQYLTCYPNNDNDDYGDKNAPGQSLCSGTTCPTGYSTDNTDCCDSDGDAHPGQTQYFTHATKCGGYDYDCVSGEEKQISSCYGSTSCSCSGSGYWRSSSCPGSARGYDSCSTNGASTHPCEQAWTSYSVDNLWSFWWDKTQGSCGNKHTTRGYWCVSSSKTCACK